MIIGYFNPFYLCHFILIFHLWSFLSIRLLIGDIIAISGALTIIGRGLLLGIIMIIAFIVREVWLEQHNLEEKALALFLDLRPVILLHEYAGHLHLLKVTCWNISHFVNKIIHSGFLRVLVPDERLKGGTCLDGLNKCIDHFNLLILFDQGVR